MTRRLNGRTALDAVIAVHCPCGKTISARLIELKERTQFACECGAVVPRDLRDFVARIEEIEAQLARRFVRTPPIA
jgi:hypothetical protein